MSKEKENVSKNKEAEMLSEVFGSLADMLASLIEDDSEGSEELEDFFKEFSESLNGSMHGEEEASESSEKTGFEKSGKDSYDQEDISEDLEDLYDYCSFYDALVEEKEWITRKSSRIIEIENLSTEHIRNILKTIDKTMIFGGEDEVIRAYYYNIRPLLVDELYERGEDDYHLSGMTCLHVGKLA